MYNKARFFLEHRLKTSNTNRAHALLVYDNIKPGCLFSYFEDLSELEKKLQKHKIVSKIKEYKYSNVVFMAKDENYLELAVSSFEETIRLPKDSKSFIEASYNLGIALGYPKTAIEAYLSQFSEDFNLHVRRNREKDPVLRKLRCYLCSEEKYETEKGVALRWREHLLRNYPVLYLKLLTEDKKIKIKYLFKRIFTNKI